MLTIESCFCDRVLSDHTAIVFHFNVQSVIWQNAFAKFQNLCESIGTEPVFGVAPDMCLQHDLFLLAGLASAIDKISYHVPDFGDVGVSRNVITVRQHESDKRPWMAAEGEFQPVECHRLIYITIEEYIKLEFCHC